MRKPNSFISTLAATADVLNAVNGGISQPSISLYELPSLYKIEIKVHGVATDHLRVDIDKTSLLVTHVIDIESFSDRVASFPRVIFNKTIPHHVLLDKIPATYENSRLVIKLPFNEKTTGYNRNITINT